MYGRDEVGRGNRSPLIIGGRHQRHFAKSDIERLEIRKVLPAVKSCHRAICHVGKKRKMILIDVEMQNVEFFRELADPVEHQHVIRGCVADIAVEAQCHGRAAHQLGSGNGVRAREQGHFMTQSDQLIREVGNNSLGPAIKPRRHTLHERRDLGNFHFCNSWPLRPYG